ncbi:MAG: carbon-phosphorus lyase [Limnochordales bacterium]|nr:carbon-phosphorus lyase [Limnochordales bacterium]
MEILFLGTAAAEGWPAVFCRCEACCRARAAGHENIRTRASLLIDGRFKFDLGPDTYHQALVHGVDLGLVRYVFITHSHSDHFYPAELEMRRPPFAHPAPGEEHDPGLDVYGNEMVVRKALELKVAEDAGEAGPADDGLESVSEPEAQPEPRQGALVRVHRVKAFRPFRAGDAELVPLRADHKPDEEALFYLFRRGGKTLLYGLDTGYFPEETWAWLEGESGRRWVGDGLDLVILDCTSGPLPGDRRRIHMNIETDLAVRERLLAAGLTAPACRFVATHFSHNGGLLHSELKAAFRQHLTERGLPPDTFIVAYDGLRLTI